MTLSTSQFVRLLKIGRATLYRWIADGKISPAPKRKVGGVTVRIWTKKDVERVRRYKKMFYGKGKGPKPKPKR